MNNYKWNNGVKKADYATNKMRNFVKNTFFSVMKKRGFDEIDLPTLDYSDFFIVNNEYYSAQNHYKSVAPNGEVLSTGDDVIKALVSFSQKSMSKACKLCASYDAYSFLVPDGQNPNEYQMGAIVVGNSGIEEEADCIVAALDFVGELGVKTPKTDIGNTEAFLGELSRFAGKEESLDRLKSILNGRLENDVDYATSQTLNELKNVEGGPSVIKDLAAKLDNQRSIDGLVDIFETINVLNAYNIEEGINVKIGYLGEKRYDNGMVFRVKDEEGKVVVYGGRCDCVKGSDKIKCLYLAVKADNAVENVKKSGKYYTEEVNKRVTVAIAPTRTAISQAMTVRKNLNEEGFVTDVVYNASESDFYKIAEENKNKMVLFINEQGEIKHS